MFVPVGLGAKRTLTSLLLTLVVQVDMRRRKWSNSRFGHNETLNGIMTDKT